MLAHVPLITTRRRPATATGLALAVLALAASACTSAPAPPTPRAGGDDFAVVRATSVAALSNGRELLARDQLEEALIELDRAKVNDPDQRADIQEALDETIRRIQALPPTPIAAPAATRTPIPSPTPLAASTPAVVAPAAPTATAAPAGFVEFADPEAGFSVSVPRDWQVQRSPQTEFGSGIVAFRDPSGKAELAIAADETAQVVSPELYAARMELQMQQVPGYALDTVVPGITAGNPSLRRNYSVRQRAPSAGAVTTARGFQVAVLRGGTSYILSATAPAGEYAQFARTFDQMVASFSFR